MRRTRLSVALSFLLVLAAIACARAPAIKFRYETDAELQALLSKGAPPYPETRFIVFSDAHLYDPNLGTEGKAFADYLAKDRKLLKESQAILEATLAAIKAESADFVVISGDMTKDGELSGHRMMAGYLAQVEASGKRVYVVPGNHDVSNGLSVKYAGDRTERVPNVSPDEFARLYADFGYSEALDRDPASLSYVAEPKAGLWLLALDACLYRENKENEEEHVGGRFLPETLAWIEKTLIQANQAGKAVLVVMHHGILEHYEGQKKGDGEYVVDDYQAISRMLAAYHARVALTGHYHAQDVTLARWPDGRFLYDIQTGSLVTYPNPYRIVSIAPSQEMTVQSKYVSSIATTAGDFREYSRTFLHQGVAGIATKRITDYRVGEAEARKLAAQVADAYVAHFSGDEKLPEGKEALQTRGLSPMAWLVVRFYGGRIQAMWRDLEPPDNDLVINLQTGEWK